VSGQQIDSLTVGVGITQEDFQAGVQKILNSLEGLKGETAAVGTSMSGSLSSVGKSVIGLGLKFAGLFVAIRGIEDVVGYFKNLSAEMANLGYAGRYLGQSSVELSRFGEVAKLAGGNAQDAIAGVQGLQSAIFGLEFQGQISQNLLMLQRLGVAYLDTAGHMRDIKDVAFDTARQLQQQLPGKANEAMRVQWAATIFGAGGLANAVGGGLAELRKFYSESARDQKNITQRLIDRQVQVSQDLTTLSYTLKNSAAKALDRLTPEIMKLIGVIRDQLIPTLDEMITDFEGWLHPKKMVDDAMSGKGVGPLGFTHPINTFEAIGIGLGIRAGQLHDWWEKQIQGYEISKLGAQVPIPAQVQGRVAPDTNLNALRLLHIEAGGDRDDPTWSKAINAYSGLLQMPGGAAAYVQEAAAAGRPLPAPTSPSYALHALSTPTAPRPATAASAIAGKPTASIAGPRVQIGQIGPIYTQAKDANGLVASINQAAQRKLLVAQADPGLA
jgi:hypothetical protein